MTADGVLHTPGFTYFGEGTFSKLSELKGRKAIIVTGGNPMKKDGLVDRACEELKNTNVEICVFNGVEENSSVKTVEEGVKKIQEFQPDWIVVLSGGSATDTVECMWALYEHPELKFEDIIESGSLPELRKKAKLVGIPSTPGTTSGITAFSVTADTEKYIRHPLVSDHTVSGIAIVDPVLSSKMSKSVTASIGMDAVAHATEALVSNIANSYTDVLATHALRLVLEYLPRTYENPSDIEARERMYSASTVAGIASTSASLGLVYSLAHKIGGESGVTHRLASATLLPYITRFNRKATNKVDWIEKELSVKDYPIAVRKLAKRVGIPPALKEAEEKFEFNKERSDVVLGGMSKNTYEDPYTLMNPRESNPEIVRMIHAHAHNGEDITK